MKIELMMISEKDRVLIKHQINAQIKDKYLKYESEKLSLVIQMRRMSCLVQKDDSFPISYRRRLFNKIERLFTWLRW